MKREGNGKRVRVRVKIRVRVRVRVGVRRKQETSQKSLTGWGRCVDRMDMDGICINSTKGERREKKTCDLLTYLL